MSNNGLMMIGVTSAPTNSQTSTTYNLASKLEDITADLLPNKKQGQDLSNQNT